MGIITNKFRTLLLVGLFAGMAWAAPVTAQPADTVQTEIVTATDTAAAQPADAAAESMSAAPATASTGASAAAVQTRPEIDPQVYKNFYYGLLIVLLVCTLVAVIGKILQVYELTRKLNGKDTTYYLYNLNANLFLIALIAGLYGVYWSFAHHGAQSFRDAVTEHGRQVDVMFIITTVICTIVLVVMHIGLFLFAYKYRATPQRKAYFYPHNNTIEKVWTIIPAIVLTVLVLFGFFTWRNITNVPLEEQEKALQIEVVGEQFTWTVRYAGRDGKIGERNYRLTTPLNSLGVDFNDKAAWDDQLGSEIVLPVNKPVRVQITSKDILHSFYIPDFRVQMNAVPGMKTYFQFTPTVTTEEMRERMGDYNYDFVMLCAKICGGGHYNMQKRVRVVTEEEFKAWLAEQPYLFTEDLRKEFQVSQAAEQDNAERALLANVN